MDYIIDIPDDDDREGDDEEVSTRQGAGKDATPVISCLFFSLCCAVAAELFMGTFFIVAGFTFVLASMDSTLKFLRIGVFQLLAVSLALMAMKWRKRYCLYIHSIIHLMLGVCYSITFIDSIFKSVYWAEVPLYICFVLVNVSL